MKKIILGLSVLAMTYSAGAQQKNFLKNNMKFYPLSAFAYGGVGLGIAYERIMDNEGKLGLNLPVYLGLTNAQDNGFGDIGTNTTFMFNPGVKFYPTGQRRVTYGIGASLFGSYGNRNGYIYDSNTGTSRFMDRNEVRAGMLVNNSVQFNIGPKFNLGLDLGLGPSYLNRYNNLTTGFSNSDGIEFMAVFGFHLGFRF